MVFLGFFFAASALVLWIVAFSNIFKGRMGQAIAFGLMALLTTGLASGLIVYGD
jgi:hypothetical protein